jgi:WD40 repeat protein/serine/threonine protein kinase
MNETDGRVAIDGAPKGESNSEPPRDRRLELALDEYLAACEAGAAPNRREFLARHAEIAVTLAECLDGLDFIRSAASQVRKPAHAGLHPLHPHDTPSRAGAASDRFAEIQPEGPLGDFRIVREIGRGGMGVVYEAVQISLGRKVALKVLPFAAALDQKQLQRFKNEAQAAATLHHTNIVPVHAVGTERGVHYYAMQFIEGQSLALIIHETRLHERDSDDIGRPPQLDTATGVRLKGEPLCRDPLPATIDNRSPALDYYAPSTPPVAALSTQVSHHSATYFRTVANLGVQAAEALDHAHALGVVHRDIKPANLLVDVRGNLWITDFGLAQVQSDSHNLTMTGDLVGTLRYMSPEQALAKRVLVDHRTDIYSLGVTLYELLTLQPAFPDDDRHELIRKIAFEEPSPPQRINPRIPADLVTIVLKSIAKNPDERYGTAQELADDLQRFLKDEPIHAKRPTWTQRARKWARRHQPVVRSAIAALFLAVAALAASTILIWRAKNVAVRALESERYGSYIQRIALAERELSANNLARAEELLAECPVELRGWEWHYLKRQHCQTMSPLRVGAAVWGAAISPDGKSIASADIDGWIKVWNSETGKEQFRFRAFPSQVKSAVYSSDGQRIACGTWVGGKECAKVFDARTGAELAVMKGDLQRDINNLALSPDGRLLVTAGSKGPWEELGIGELVIWDSATGQELASLLGHTDIVHGLAFSPDGRMIASGGIERDRTVKLWDIETRREVMTLRGHSRRVNCVAFSSVGELIASGSGRWGHQTSGEVIIWDRVTGRALRTLRGHFDGIWGLAFSPDGSRLATAGQDMTVKVWDVATGHETLTLRGHTDLVTSVAFTGDGNRLVSTSQDRTVRVWDGRPWQDEAECQEFLTLHGHRDGVNSVAYSPDGRRIASGSADGTARLWDAWTGKELRTIRVTTGQVSGVAFSPDGRQLALSTWGARENVLQICDAETGAEVKSFKGPGESYVATCVAFSPTKHLVASGGTNFTVNLWQLDSDTGDVILSALQKDSINGLAFTPDGEQLASTCEDGSVALWNATNAELVARLSPEHQQRAVGVAFSRNGKMLVTSSWDRTITVWGKSDDDAGWQPRHVLRDPAGGAEGVAISPDGSRVAWGSTDSTVKVWTATTGEIQTLRGHRSWVHSVSFNLDGRRIASASQDGTVKIWELPPLPE